MCLCLPFSINVVDFVVSQPKSFINHKPFETRKPYGNLWILWFRNGFFFFFNMNNFPFFLCVFSCSPFSRGVWFLMWFLVCFQNDYSHVTYANLYAVNNNGIKSKIMVNIGMVSPANVKQSDCGNELKYISIKSYSWAAICINAREQTYIKNYIQMVSKRWISTAQ